MLCGDGVWRGIIDVASRRGCESGVGRGMGLDCRGLGVESDEGDM